MEPLTTTNPTSREQVATEELEQFRWLHLYADRMLIKDGRYVAAARHLEQTARRWIWKSLGLALLFASSGTLAVLRFDRHGRYGELVMASLWYLMAGSQLLQWALLMRRTRGLVLRIERLFPELERPDDGPVTV